MKVIHHGNLGEYKDGKKLYASLPVELARDQGLTANAARVALFVWSHKESYTQSAALVAKALGMHRDTVANALANLQDRGWLVREQVWRPGKAKPSSEVWHLQMSNTPFTDDAKRTLRGDNMPKNPASSDGNMPKNPAPPCLEIRHPPAQELGTLVVNTSSARSADYLSSTTERAEKTGTFDAEYAAYVEHVMASGESPPDVWDSEPTDDPWGGEPQ
ncbi:helix-turn-helix domain-containing protein [Mycolicibacterium rhodesiae]|nr:helix-turn-helix domain-containing protein [Mycolicibacterium rhodesiae]MCV7348274.1 helix-turn-helix domain-containing protein [Mycolicibacterium rhodesiae]